MNLSLKKNRNSLEDIGKPSGKACQSHKSAVRNTNKENKRKMMKTEQDQISQRRPSNETFKLQYILQNKE